MRSFESCVLMGMMHYTPDAHAVEGNPSGRLLHQQLAVFLRGCIAYDCTRRRLRIYGDPGHAPHLELTQAQVDDIRNAHTLAEAEAVVGRILATTVRRP